MSRRAGSTYAVFVAALIAACVFTFAGAASDSPQAVMRQTQQLAADWRFHLGDASADVTTVNFNDSAWESVSIPHTWNRLGEPGVQRTAATNNQRGVGWYRLQFKAPAASRNQRQFLQFDAVGTLADAWLNGSKIGSHAGAFSRFRFDVTDTLRPGQVNLLVVKADNSKPAPGNSTQDVIPLAGMERYIQGIGSKGKDKE